MEEVHHQYSGGYVVWTCDIINAEAGVQYMAMKTAQGVVGGCIYLGQDLSSIYSAGHQAYTRLKRCVKFIN